MLTRQMNVDVFHPSGVVSDVSADIKLPVAQDKPTTTL